MDLKTYLKKERITQRMFANIMGCSPNYINLICGSHKKPGRHMALAIVQATKGDVSLRELMEKNDN